MSNQQPSGTSGTIGTTVTMSAGNGLAAEYAPGLGKELLPIPQTTLDTDPALKQNAGCQTSALHIERNVMPRLHFYALNLLRLIRLR